jgi:chromatin structure-remodeling complex subunit RSC3/30
MGLHQESNQSQLPFFLNELRRRSFANAFSSDKALSTFFGRPPRIAMRYCSRLPPYDLTDEELIAPAEIRNRALAKLDPAGWNTNGDLNRQTWARIKLMINAVREEALELSLAPPAPDAEQREKAL